MRKIFYLFFILSLIATSCKRRNLNNFDRKVYIPHYKTEKVFNEIKNLPDTILKSKSFKKNKFRFDISNVKIDNKKTSELDGEWVVNDGTLRFLNTFADKGDKVIFRNKNHSTLTGWGEIIYNRAVNFYFADSASHVYEFYITPNGKLVLTQYNYRNEDFSMRIEPESIIQELTINYINKNKISLMINNKSMILKREKNTANNI